MTERLVNTQKAETLFGDWQETLIWSCLQNIMGKIYVDNREQPESAMALIGDFCFFAGKTNEELVKYRPEECRQNFLIMVPQNDAWAKLIEKIYAGNAKKVTRYAIKKDTCFQKEKLLETVAALPDAYSLHMMDETLFQWCKKHGWSQDFVSQYETYENYRELGLGVLVLKDGIPVAGASSYTRYRDGIEIEIDTKEEYRRQGLAYACGAKLILECLERGLYPSWDAQNLWSVALAEKLGYTYWHDYTAYEISGWCSSGGDLYL